MATTMEVRKVGRVPSFGNWDFSDDELPITQYFDARQAVLLHEHFFGEEGDLEERDLFEVPLYYFHKGGEVEEKVFGEAQKKPVRRGRAPRAVDEDLYKIPEEFLCKKKKKKKKKKKRMVKCDFWKRCLELVCVCGWA